MTTALYYPHTTIRTEGLIKTALLLWDDIECIVPRQNWKIEQRFKQKTLNEALELITRPYTPTHIEKEKAHHDVVEFLQQEGSRFYLENALGQGMHRGHNYLIYPDKFLDRTWYALEEHGLAQWDHMSSDYGVPPALGLLMMSSLADACAGTQKQKVTDRLQAYSLLERAKATLLGAPFVEGLDPSQVAPELDRLVTISLKVLDARRISIDKLLKFRQREAKSSSADYRKIRIKYFTALRSYIERMLKEGKSKSDVQEIEKQFQLDMRDDLKSLKKELNLATLESLFSKEMAMTVLVVGGSVISPITGLTSLAATLKGVGIAPLVATKLKHVKERRKALLSHNMSWLYLVNERRISLR